MNHLANRGRQAIVAAITVNAGIPGKFLRVVAEVNLVVGLPEITQAQSKLTLPIAVEAGTRDDVEHAVSAITHIGVIAAALDFKIIDVLGSICGPRLLAIICVGNLDAVDQPLV